MLGHERPQFVKERKNVGDILLEIAMARSINKVNLLSSQYRIYVFIDLATAISIKLSFICPLIWVKQANCQNYPLKIQYIGQCSKTLYWESRMPAKIELIEIKSVFFINQSINQSNKEIIFKLSQNILHIFDQRTGEKNRDFITSFRCRKTIKISLSSVKL